MINKLKISTLESLGPNVLSKALKVLINAMSVLAIVYVVLICARSWGAGFAGVVLYWLTNLLLIIFRYVCPMLLLAGIIRRFTSEPRQRLLKSPLIFFEMNPCNAVATWCFIGVMSLADVVTYVDELLCGPIAERVMNQLST